MEENFFVEVDCQQKSYDGERICGDVFLSGRVKEENRIVVGSFRRYGAWDKG